MCRSSRSATSDGAEQYAVVVLSTAWMFAMAMAAYLAFAAAGLIAGIGILNEGYIKTMSDIARNQNLAITILPLLLGLALLRLLLKACRSSFLGRH